jgi:hypothetical protein
MFDFGYVEGMKHIALTVLALSSLISAPLANADFVQDRVRPVSRGEAKIVEAQGSLQNVNNLVLLKMRADAAKMESYSVELDGESLPVLLVMKSVKESCGSIITEYASAPYTLTIADHTRRFCKDRRDFRFEGTFKVEAPEVRGGLMTFGIDRFEALILTTVVGLKF